MQKKKEKLKENKRGYMYVQQGRNKEKKCV
jgi:hypothetical protein